MNQEYVETFSKEMGECIELECKEFINYPVSFTRPEGGMYLFPRANKENFDSQMFTSTLLSKKMVAVLLEKSFDAYPEHFRLSLSKNKRDIKEGMKRIRALQEEWL